LSEKKILTKNLYFQKTALHNVEQSAGDTCNDRMESYKETMASSETSEKEEDQGNVFPERSTLSKEPINVESGQNQTSNKSKTTSTRKCSAVNCANASKPLFSFPKVKEGCEKSTKR